ncbi:MAG: hypothetical protein AB7U73_03570 [Pirellulales bacterium]
MVNHGHRAASPNIQHEVAQSPIRGTLQAVDFELLTEVERGLAVERAVSRFKTGRQSRGLETTDAMLRAFRQLAERIRASSP